MGNQTETNKKPQKERLKIFCKSCSQKFDVTELPPLSVIACPICNTDMVVPLPFENYLLDRLEGVGGTAKVYRGTDIALNRVVAVKIMSEKTLTDPDAEKQFLQEARTAATLTHSAVIPVYTCGVCEGKPYIVMQYMVNGSLETALIQKKGKLPIRDVIRWMLQIAGGLEYACHTGIVHHDVKPANIMLDQDNNAKIGDFGLARVMKSAAISQENNHWVSPEYVSPEKVTSGQEDYKGDIFSFGVTLFQLLTNHFPFSGATPEEMMNARLITPPENPVKYNRSIPQQLSFLIMRMLSTNPAERPEYQEIITALSNLLRVESSRSRKQSLSRKIWKISAYGAAAVILLLAGNLIPKIPISNDSSLPASLKKAFAETTLAETTLAETAYNEAVNKMNPVKIRTRCAMLAIFADYKTDRKKAEKTKDRLINATGDSNGSTLFPEEKKNILRYLFTYWDRATFSVSMFSSSREDSAEAVLAILLKMRGGQEDKASYDFILNEFKELRKSTWLEKLPDDFLK